MRARKEKWKEKGKSKGKGKGKKGEKFEGWCNSCGTWGHKAANCWHGKEKQVHQIPGGAATVSSSSSQSTVMTNDVGARGVGHTESVQEDIEMGWLFMIADAVAINQLSMDGAQSLVVGSGAACVSQKFRHAGTFAITAGMLARNGSSISKWQDAQCLGDARGGFQRNGSAREDFHSEDPLCCL